MSLATGKFIPDPTGVGALVSAFSDRECAVNSLCFNRLFSRVEQPRRLIAAPMFTGSEHIRLAANVVHAA
jgi:hypothetical protein